MAYDIERDPGRSYESVPSESVPADPGTVLELGAVGLALAEVVTNTQVTGAGMSLRDTIAQISGLQRAIKDQTMLIDSFLKSNADTMQLVRTELAGSSKGYDQQMLAALTQMETSLKSSLTELQQASGALDRVRAI